jgi:hypothetical protein
MELENAHRMLPLELMIGLYLDLFCTKPAELDVDDLKVYKLVLQLNLFF